MISIGLFHLFERFVRSASIRLIFKNSEMYRFCESEEREAMARGGRGVEHRNEPSARLLQLRFLPTPPQALLEELT
jgi:hypothetical protein